MRIALVIDSFSSLQNIFERMFDVLSPALASQDEVFLWLAEPPPAKHSFSLPKALNTKVLCPDRKLILPEMKLLWIKQCEEECQPHLILFYGNSAGHELATRLSARLSCGCFPDVYKISRREDVVALTRKSCGSHLDLQAAASRSLRVATIARGRAQTIFPLENSAEFLCTNAPIYSTASWLINSQLLEKPKTNPLETAPRLLLGGQGLGSSNACEKLRKTALSLGMTPGYTRPVALSGWCHLHEIVGQSGCRTSPEVCIALGISGAAAFLAGVSGAKTLIAVNTDPSAPIFKHAHFGIIGDANNFLGSLSQL